MRHQSDDAYTGTDAGGDVAPLVQGAHAAGGGPVGAAPGGIYNQYGALNADPYKQQQQQPVFPAYQQQQPPATAPPQFYSAGDGGYVSASPIQPQPQVPPPAYTAAGQAHPY